MVNGILIFPAIIFKKAGLNFNSSFYTVLYRHIVVHHDYFRRNCRSLVDVDHTFILYSALEWNHHAYILYLGFYGSSSIKKTFHESITDFYPWRLYLSAQARAGFATRVKLASGRPVSG